MKRRRDKIAFCIALVVIVLCVLVVWRPWEKDDWFTFVEMGGGARSVSINTLEHGWIEVHDVPDGCLFWEMMKPHRRYRLQRYWNPLSSRHGQVIGILDENGKKLSCP
jgi:hypothetical protein